MTWLNPWLIGLSGWAMAVALFLRWKQAESEIDEAYELVSEAVDMLVKTLEPPSERAVRLDCDSQ